MNINHKTLFPSIVSEIECDFYNLIKPGLVEWIYNYQKSTDGVFLSNRGGWQSPSDFHLDNSFFEFKDYIIKNSLMALKHYELNFSLSNMWININQKGNYNVFHDHPGSLISGVFWIKASENCGSLIFNSPHSFSQYLLLNNVDCEIAKDHNYYDSFTFTPKEGTIILFPSDLKHGVEESESDEDRISIAFNLTTER
jgi:uncharacterized protein (TIGR02466 family)